jgi:hypothetical protein
LKLSNCKHQLNTEYLQGQSAVLHNQLAALGETVAK